MIDTEKFFRFLKKKIKFFSGVPDSNLKYLINLFDDKKVDHHICVNEGSAVAMGIGYYLSSKKIAAVYMQNSGLSNAMNPLLSIAHKKVYSTPLLLIIGWRGSPKSKDEPQHLVKGKITPSLLKLAGIKYIILKNSKSFLDVSKLIEYGKKNNSPVAVLVKNNSLKKTVRYKNEKNINQKFNILRKNVIEELCNQIKTKTYIVSNTGFGSRELDQILNQKKNKFIKPFYMIGGMGHTSMVAISNALNKKKFDTICLDGDGSLIMHLGSLINTGNLKLSNFKHILINNYQHESVGGQTSNIGKIAISDIAKNCGYEKTIICKEIKNLKDQINILLKSKKSSFMEVKVLANTSKNLSRPKNFSKIKNSFIK